MMAFYPLDFSNEEETDLCYLNMILFFDFVVGIENMILFHFLVVYLCCGILIEVVTLYYCVLLIFKELPFIKAHPAIRSIISL